MMTRRKTLDWRLVILTAGMFLSAGLLLGCGGPAPHADKPTAEVVVNVSYGGQPVTEGRVDLNNEQTGESGGAELDSNGAATIPGVALGSYTVTVVPPPADAAPPQPGQPAAPAKEYPNIPKKVRMIKSSPLKADVKEGSNEFKFDLKDAGAST